MRIRILIASSIKDAGVAPMVDDYLRRAERHAQTELVVVKGEKIGDARAAPVALRTEAERIRKSTPAGAWTVALDIQGRSMDSEELARWLGAHRDRSHPALCFYVGSAFGLDHELVGSCHERLSLSRLTLPHQLAVLVLAEQLYRATTLWSGAPYHK